MQMSVAEEGRQYPSRVLFVVVVVVVSTLISFEFILSGAAAEKKHPLHSCFTFMFDIFQLTVTLLPHF